MMMQNNSDLGACCVCEGTSKESFAQSKRFAISCRKYPSLHEQVPKHVFGNGEWNWGKCDVPSFVCVLVVQFWSALFAVILLRTQ